MSTTIYSPTSWLSNRLRSRLTALAAGLLLAPAAAWAQAPANDNCSGAIALTPAATCTAVTGTNVNATASGTPAPSCGGTTTTASNDVWYSIVVPTGGGITVTTSLIASSTFDDTVLELYSGTCGTLTSIGCNDDDATAADGSSSLTVRSLTAGSTIYARVFGYGSTPTGTFGICASIPAALPTAPANNECATATVLTPSAAGGACAPTSGTVAGATQSNAPILCGGFTAATARDVWYSFVATGTSHTITVTGTFDGVLEVLSGACGTLTNVGCADAATNNETLTLNALTVGTTYRARYYPYANAPTSSTFTICVTTPTPLPATDAAVAAIFSVGKAPVSAPQITQAVIRNTGSSALTNVPVSLIVTGATAFTDVKLVTSLAAGASTTVTFASYTPATVGNNTVTVSVPADGLNTNNSQVYAQAVTANNLSYIDDSQALNATGVGVSSTTPGGTLASRYVINSSSTIGEVRLNFPASAASTSTYQVVVLNATTAGLPNAVIFTSATLNRPTAAGVITVPVTGATVNGTFFVGLKEVSGNVGIGYQVEDPLRPATFYYQIATGGAWTDVNTTTLRTRLAIEVGFSSRVLANRSAVLEQAMSVFPNPAHQDFTLRLPAIAGQRSAQLTLINTLGQQVQSRTVQLNAAGTDTQMDVSNLAKGIYTLRVQTADQVATKQVSVE